MPQARGGISCSSIVRPMRRCKPQPDQVAAIRSKPIRDLGVQDAYAAALERDTLPAYEEFVAAYPGDPLAKRVRA